MTWNGKEYNKEKYQFKSYYCASCKQRKVCGLLTEYTDWESYCCRCYFQNKHEESREYSNYQLTYQQKKQEKKDRIQQLQLLRNYSGCPQCRNLAVDAYSLYENNRLVCQPCLAKKAGGSSHPISFTEQSKWYKKRWKTDLTEWLENFSRLPVNAKCAKEWARDGNHLNNCQCLEIEVKNLVDLFTGSLKEMEEKLKDCQCETSPKTRVDSDYYAWCERCEKDILAASKKRVIKNRNNPKFWGLNVSEKVLCLNCLQKFQEKMPLRKKYLLAEYLKRGY